MKRAWMSILTCAMFGAAVVRADDAKDKAQQPEPVRTGMLHLGLSRTWIGAMCAPTDRVLQAQLGLKENQGLVVLDVMAESPAAKAGLKQHDVIAAIDGKELQRVADLMDAVREAGDKELKLDIIRAGKKETLAVTPGERPDLRRTQTAVPFPAAPFAGGVRTGEQWKQLQEQLEKMRDKLPEGDVKRIEQWIEQLKKGENQPLRMQMFGPGVVMHRAHAGGNLPSGVSVSITKEGNSPTKIHVERGDEKWDITEKELDKLPKDLQGPIGAMLGGAGGGGAAFMVPGGAGGIAVGSAAASDGNGNVKIEIKTDDGGGQVVVSPEVPEAVRKQLNDEVEKMRRQVEQLQKQIDELKKAPAGKVEKAPAPAKKEPKGKERT